MVPLNSQPEVILKLSFILGRRGEVAERPGAVMWLGVFYGCLDLLLHPSESDKTGVKLLGKTVPLPLLVRVPGKRLLFLKLKELRICKLLKRVV